MKYRLERAKELLKRGFSVKSTALSCGFSDSLYFSKLFKAAVGEPPGRYGKDLHTPQICLKFLQDAPPPLLQAALKQAIKPC